MAIGNFGFKGDAETVELRAAFGSGVGTLMDDKQVDAQVLYARVNRTCIRVGIALACSWLFAGFSYYLSRKTGIDWFARSGSVMALVGAAATFRLGAGFRKQLATGLQEELASVRQEMELTLNPPPLYRLTSYFGYVTGIVGTAIWGYGDLLR